MKIKKQNLLLLASLVWMIAGFNVLRIGKEQTATVYSIEGNVVGQYNTYIERIDDVVDALCNEITRLENENMQLSWDVLHIGSLINSLVNEIRTLCN